jgi:signal transduction histidine kinase
VELVSVEQMKKSDQLKFQQRIKAENIKFIVNCSPGTTVLINPVLLEFILINLIDNALFFTRQERNVVRTVTLTIAAKNGRLKLDIYDNGIGIIADMRKRIFTMFFKGTEKSKGNGLGLYIVYKCVQALEGTIEVESEEGEYTRFLIDVPLQENATVQSDGLKALPV